MNKAEMQGIINQGFAVQELSNLELRLESIGFGEVNQADVLRRIAEMILKTYSA